MNTRATVIMTRLRQRIGAVAHSVSSTIRLSPIYIGIAIVVAIAWGVSTLYTLEPVGTQQSQPHSANTGQAMNMTVPSSDNGEDKSMPLQTPDAHNSTSSHASIQATDNGATVSVNGNSVSVPPNQNYHQTFDSSADNTTTHTDVSVKNNSDTSGRTVTLNLQSSSQSVSNGTTTNGGQ